VTLLLLDPQHEIRHLLIADHLRVEDFPNVLFTDSLIGLAPQFNSFHGRGSGHIWVCDHRCCFRQCRHPQRRADSAAPAGSAAGQPELRQHRRAPLLATPGDRFLAHLGVIASFSIENTINRARLVRSGSRISSPAGTTAAISMPA
jgi:hypothetical protein